jgi:hypothetical protein
MGQHNSKGKLAINDKIAEYTVLRSKNDIVIDLNSVKVGVYNINGLSTFVFNVPRSKPASNKFWLTEGTIEVLCEQDPVDIDMIKKQISHMQRDKVRWDELYKNSFIKDED